LAKIGSYFQKGFKEARQRTEAGTILQFQGHYFNPSLKGRHKEGYPWIFLNREDFIKRHVVN